MAVKDRVEMLEKATFCIKLNLLKLCNKKAIHIGGDMSVCDVMTALWQYQIRYRPADPHWDERDRFVLSKGHASAVTSFNQAAIGCYRDEEIHEEYATDFGRFGMHSCNLMNPHVEVSTGSLGHGLPVSVGIAAALRVKGNTTSRVYTVMGDGEQQEGSIWEAAMLAPQLRLGNLVVFVDANKLSFDGRIEDLLSLGCVGEKWRSFRWNVVEIDGHDMSAIVDALDQLPAVTSEVPTVVVANTVKGHGISFMENNVAWHAGQLSDIDYQKAMEEVTEAFRTREEVTA